MVEGRLNDVFGVGLGFDKVFGILFGRGDVGFFLVDEFGRGKGGIGEFFDNREGRSVFVLGGSNSFFDENLEVFGIERLDPGTVLAAAFDKSAKPG